MATSTTIQKLPLEMLECIESYLSLKDLARCCAVCISWREVFSNNIFWRKYCNIKLSTYLESATCLVEPLFTTPCVESSSLTPLSGWRLCFLREQHYLNNFRSGRHRREEIEFDCDDSLSYNIKVEFVANDYMLLHSTFETQVWNVAQEPNLVMTIPFQLVELWEQNLYQFHESKLIVVQCNVVQIFNICVHSKTWSSHRTFFFDKPEEFSLKITKDTDVNDMFKNTCYEVGDYVEKVICGKFLIGIVTTKAALQNPVIHIWDLNSCKKIKEEIFSDPYASYNKEIYFRTSSTSQDNIIIAFNMRTGINFAVFSLTSLKLIVSFICPKNSVSLLCEGYLFISFEPKNGIFMYDFNTQVMKSVDNFDQGKIICWHTICDKIMATNSTDLILINPESKVVQAQSCMDIQIKSFEVVKDKYIAIHDMEGNFRQLWEYRSVNSGKITEETALTKLFSLPPDIGIYRTTNELCSKIVLERANKVIVLNFW